MACGHEAQMAKLASQLKANEDRIDEMEDERESREASMHKRAMRHMPRGARRRYAMSHDTDRERELVGKIAAEMDDDDGPPAPPRREEAADDKEDEEDPKSLGAQVALMNRKIAEMRQDIRASRFTDDVTPRVAEVLSAAESLGMNVAPLRAAIETMPHGERAALFERTQGQRRAARRFSEVGYRGNALQAAVTPGGAQAGYATMADIVGGAV